MKIMKADGLSKNGSTEFIKLTERERLTDVKMRNPNKGLSSGEERLGGQFVCEHHSGHLHQVDGEQLERLKGQHPQRVRNVRKPWQSQNYAVTDRERILILLREVLMKLLKPSKSLASSNRTINQGLPRCELVTRYQVENFQKCRLKSFKDTVQLIWQL